LRPDITIIQKYLNVRVNFIRMRIFRRKENVSATLSEEISILKAEITKLKREVLSNSLDIDAMRDKVLRKIQKRKPNDKNYLEEDGFNSVRELHNQ